METTRRDMLKGTAAALAAVPILATTPLVEGAVQKPCKPALGYLALRIDIDSYAFSEVLDIFKVTETYDERDGQLHVLLKLAVAHAASYHYRRSHIRQARYYAPYGTSERAAWVEHTPHPLDWCFDAQGRFRFCPKFSAIRRTASAAALPIDIRDHHNHVKSFDANYTRIGYWRDLQGVARSVGLIV